MSATAPVAPPDPVRVLVCLDDARKVPPPVERFVNRVRARGFHVSFMHVLDPSDLPAFFDQPNEASAWREAFARDRCAPKLRAGAPLEIRVGLPAAEILDVARKDGTDLIVIAFPEDVAGTRAEAVRTLHSLGEGVVVVVPVEER